MMVFPLALALSGVTHGTVIMVHGAGGGGWEYDSWKPAFRTAGWKVVARDLVPAKGGLKETKFEDYVIQVEGWAAKSDRPMVIVGASLGGPLAVRASSKLKPDALVLVNPVAPAGFDVHRKPADFPAVVKWAGGPLKESQDAMPDSDEKTVKKAWKLWRDESGAVMNELSKGVSVQVPRAPVLIVLGDQDKDVPISVGMAIAAAYKADVRIFTGTSHVGPLLGRRAPEVARTVTGWLSERFSRKLDSRG